MKQDFVVKAAKRLGTFLTTSVSAFMLVAGGGQATARTSDNGISVTTTVSSSQNIETILYPGVLETFKHNGQKGCVAYNEETPKVLALIAKLEGLMPVGKLDFVRTLKDGVHAFNMQYSISGDYAYILANKAEGALCISEKLHDLTFQNTGHYQAINLVQNTAYTSEQCSFTNRYGQICGTFDKVSAALKGNGFAVDWQGIKDNGDVLTLLSGNGKSYFLTTDNATGATVVTGTGRHEFEYIDVPPKRHSQFVEKR
tara:strand:+ start:122 stop:889 length:768 start_codon:yes stop_codon:yes gene_type:complete